MNNLIRERNTDMGDSNSKKRSYTNLPDIVKCEIFYALCKTKVKKT